jgi:hypothetical protein
MWKCHCCRFTECDQIIRGKEDDPIRGSFNFTKAAEENNAENLLVIHEKKLAERYTKNWQEHDRYLEVYGGRGR